MSALGEKSWLLITVFFLVFVAGLVTVVIIAEKNKPAAVPVRTQTP